MLKKLLFMVISLKADPLRGQASKRYCSSCAILLKQLILDANSLRAITVRSNLLHAFALNALLTEMGLSLKAVDQRANFLRTIALRGEFA